MNIESILLQSCFVNNKKHIKNEEGNKWPAGFSAIGFGTFCGFTLYMDTTSLKSVNWYFYEESKRRWFIRNIINWIAKKKSWKMSVVWPSEIFPWPIYVGERNFRITSDPKYSEKSAISWLEFLNKNVFKEVFEHIYWDNIYFFFVTHLPGSLFLSMYRN